MSIQSSPKAVLITGAAKRIGKAIAELLHAQGMQIIIHYHSSQDDAESLCVRFNQQRPNSAVTVQANLNHFEDLSRLIDEAANAWGYLDVLVNNASGFFPTPIGTVDEAQWTQLMNANLKAPFFLSQSAAPWLQQRNGAIINLGDIHAERPLKNYPVYCMSKAGLIMMTFTACERISTENPRQCGFLQGLFCGQKIKTN